MPTCPYCDTNFRPNQESALGSVQVALPNTCPRCGAWELNGAGSTEPWERMTGWHMPEEDPYAQLVFAAFHFGFRPAQSLIDPPLGVSPEGSLAPTLKRQRSIT